MLRHVASKGDSEIVAHRELLAALILEIVNQLAVLAILAPESFGELEDGRGDFNGLNVQFNLNMIIYEGGQVTMVSRIRQM